MKFMTRQKYVKVYRFNVNDNPFRLITLNDTGSSVSCIYLRESIYLYFLINISKHIHTVGHVPHCNSGHTKQWKKYIQTCVLSDIVP